MVNLGAPLATIDWESAEVRGTELTLPLHGRLSAASVDHMRDLVRRLPPAAERRTIAVRKTSIKVSPVRRGVAPDLHQLLERLVADTNAAASEEAAARARRHSRRTDGWAKAAAALLIVLVGAAVAIQWTEWDARRVAIALASVTVVIAVAALWRDSRRGPDEARAASWSVRPL
jgi:hypothetical protein